MTLIAQYLFEDNLLDETANNNDGTLNGGGTATYPAGVDGTSLLFNGATYVGIGDTNFDFERTDTFSFAAWFRTNNNDINENLFGKTSTDTGYQILLTQDNELEVILSNSASNRIIVDTSGIAVRDDNWQHMTVTYDGSSDASGVNIYVNGQLVTMTVVEDTLTSSILHNDDLVIGSIGESESQFFDGDMDYVSIYDNELTAQDIINAFVTEGVTVKALKFLDSTVFPSTVVEDAVIKVDGKFYIGEDSNWVRM